MQLKDQIWYQTYFHSEIYCNFTHVKLLLNVCLFVFYNQGYTDASKSIVQHDTTLVVQINKMDILLKFTFRNFINSWGKSFIHSPHYRKTKSFFISKYPHIDRKLNCFISLWDKIKVVKRSDSIQEIPTRQIHDFSIVIVISPDLLA